MKDIDIVLGLVKHNDMTLKYASDVVRKDKIFIGGIAKLEGFFSKDHLVNGEMIEKLFWILQKKHHGNCLNSVSDEIKFNNKVV